MCERFIKDGATACPACSGKRFRKTAVIGVHECVRCNAVFGTCYLGQSYEFRMPRWHKGESTATRYYDFELLTGTGIKYEHGWVDVESKCVTQVG